MKILGTGVYVPSKTISNDYFTDVLKLDTSKEWIELKTGIKNRHYVEQETLLDLAYFASKRAMEKAGVSNVDMIILATSTPDTSIPSTATLLTERLGIRCAAFDLNNACSSFIYALDIASRYLEENKTILVIGADISTRVTNFKDRLTSIFFADGAGAVIIQESTSSRKLASYMMASGNHGAISTLNSGKLEMVGKSIWDFTHEVVPQTIEELANKAKIKVNDIDWVVPHQPNARMLESCFKTMGFPFEKVIVNVEKYGNTISASIPIALYEGLESKIQRKDIVCLVGWGAGLSWGGILLEY